MTHLLHGLGYSLAMFSFVMFFITIFYLAILDGHDAKWSWRFILPFYLLGLIPALGVFLICL